MSSQIFGDRKWNGKFQRLGRERKSDYLVGTVSVWKMGKVWRWAVEMVK